MSFVDAGHRPYWLVRSGVSSVLLLCLWATSGCSGSKPLVPVAGSVKYKQKSVNGATVMFHPENRSQNTASGVTEDDGTFTLVSSLKEGVQPGKYRVTIVWPDESKRKKPEFGQLSSPEEPPDLLNGKYASAKDTPLQAEISSDTTEVPTFNLE